MMNKEELLTDRQFMLKQLKNSLMMVAVAAVVTIVYCFLLGLMPWEVFFLIYCLVFLGRCLSIIYKLRKIRKKEIIYEVMND